MIATDKPEHRIAALDGIRGCAIALVLVWHYFACQSKIPEGGLVADLQRMAALTWSGVDLFFVLSGFLIGGILLAHRHAAGRGRTFYIRRACRILPVYLLLLGSFAFAMAIGLHDSPRYAWLFLEPLPWWVYLTFTQNIAMGFDPVEPNWLAVTWSLAIEEQFYLVAPALVWLTPRRALPWVLMVGIIAAVLLRQSVGGYHAALQMPMRADSLLLGVLLACAAHARDWPRASGLAGRLLLAVAFWILLLGAGVLTFRNVLGPWLHLWLALLYGSFILLPLAKPGGAAALLLSFGPLRRLGQWSYPIYLFHQPVAGLIHGYWRGAEPAIRSWDDAWLTIAALGVTLIVAAVVHAAIERPMMAFGHRWRYGAADTPPAPRVDDSAAPAAADPRITL